MKNEKIIEIRKEQIGTGEEKYLNGKASYRRVFDKFITDAVLCNNIVEVDPDIFYNQEAGFYTYEELYNDKLEELKEEYKDKIVEGLGITQEQARKGFKSIEELEQEAEDWAEYEQYNFEFYQYFIIGFSSWSLEYLKELNQHTLQIMYSDKLGCYILGVGHWGTGWDYVGSDFELKIIN